MNKGQKITFYKPGDDKTKLHYCKECWTDLTGKTTHDVEECIRKQQDARWRAAVEEMLTEIAESEYLNKYRRCCQEHSAGILRELLIRMGAQ